MTGLYQTGSTCSTKLGQGYGSSYDAWGNVTSRSYNGITATLSYDSLDHLVKWDAGSNSQEQYVYDAAGHRVLRRSTGTGSTTMTVYAFGNEEHLYSAAGVNQSNMYYYSLAGHLVGESTGSSTNVFLTDALGSVITTISATAGSAAVQGNQAYGPYGNTRYQAGAMGTAKGFTGQYQDATGLDYYGARYYDPVVGRFVSADTVQGNGAGLDPYAYVGGNPETNNDPTGHCGLPCLIGFFVIWGADLFFTEGNAAIAVAPPAHGGPSYPPGSPQPVPAPTAGPTPGPIAGTTTNGAGTPQNSVRWAMDRDLAHHTYQSQQSQGGTSPGASGSGTSPRESTSPAPAPGGNGWKPPSQRPPAAPAGEPCSFTPQTQVKTDHGEQAIGTLQVGERVLAYNPKTHKMEYEPILHVWINHDNDLVDLTITTTTKGQRGKAATKTSEVIHTNQKHPFLTIEDGFVPVRDLKLGMHVLRADGRVGVVTGWQVVLGTKVMYNLEVAQDHTFVVGVGQWVVHNDCPASSTSGNSPYAQRGNEFHYDLENGGPAQLREMYPQTDFDFKPRGVAGPDVEVTGGVHPSNYPGSTWYPGSDFGDFKPDNPLYQPAKFLREIRIGKLPPGTVPIWYDPIQYIITHIGLPASD